MSTEPIKHQFPNCPTVCDSPQHHDPTQIKPWSHVAPNLPAAGSCAGGCPVSLVLAMPWAAPSSQLLAHGSVQRCLCVEGLRSSGWRTSCPQGLWIQGRKGDWANGRGEAFRSTTSCSSANHLVRNKKQGDDYVLLWVVKGALQNNFYNKQTTS